MHDGTNETEVQADPRLYFEILNEIGIINQLARTVFETRMPDGLTVPHFSVLNHLVRLGDGSSPLRIANAFQVPKTSMTNTLAGLEKRNLIEMRPNPEDGRSKLVYLTAAGRQMRETCIASLGPDIARMATEIPRQHVDTILPLLREIRTYLDQNRIT